ncbi:14220_t:CDS:1 [Funneliformis caledonium]|uniref:14220_t:CDS:1 n=1 Tax=Funneliformis caledonium TaxID=1117310 RepID=A0A9N8W7F3_9GLOM|nr:14220_t:CDS:1 [Funneliformis caledonium]
MVNRRKVMVRCKIENIIGTSRPPFPPVLTAKELLPKGEKSKKKENVRIPNAFIAYRMALVRELKSKRVPCNRSNISSHASRLWKQEPKEVKDVYRKMANDAQLLFNQIRGLTFLYEQSIPNGKFKREIESQSSPTQDFEEKVLTTKCPQYEAPMQQENVMLNPPSVLNHEQPMYYDNSVMSSPESSASSNFQTFDQSLSGQNPFVYINTRNIVLEQRVQELENQLEFFYQLYFGGNNNYSA